MPTPFITAQRPRPATRGLRQRAQAAAMAWLRFTAMTLVGMFAVWALVLIFG